MYNHEYEKDFLNKTGPGPGKYDNHISFKRMLQHVRPSFPKVNNSQINYLGCARHGRCQKSVTRASRLQYRSVNLEESCDPGNAQVCNP